MCPPVTFPVRFHVSGVISALPFCFHVFHVSRNRILEERCGHSLLFRPDTPLGFIQFGFGNYPCCSKSYVQDIFLGFAMFQSKCTASLRVIEDT